MRNPEEPLMSHAAPIRTAGDEAPARLPLKKAAGSAEDIYSHH